MTDKVYLCNGFTWADNNGHLCSKVGQRHTLGDWLKIAFPDKDAAAFFANDNDKYIIEYLHKNMRIRLVK